MQNWHHVVRGAFVCVVAVVLTLMAPVAKADADAQNDAKQPAVGSITLLLTESNESSASPMEGGKIALYRVATVDTSHGAAYDVLAGQFASSAVVEKIPSMTKKELDDYNFRIASSLEAELAERDAKPLQTANVAGGKASFSAVEEGLYLVVQAATSKDGQRMSAFLLSVPNDAGELDVVCRPKPGVPTGDDGKDDPNNKKDNSGGGTTTNSKKDGTSGGMTTAGKATASTSTTSPDSIGLKVPATGDRPATGLPLAFGGLVLVLAGVLARRRIGRSGRTS